ncbi:ABC transporter membrane protein [Streptococcus pneumoniae]|nr:ABC transporter membrane protein [Streptococcus pneumoniae]
MIQIVVRSVKDYSENRKFDTEILELRKTYSKMKYGRNNVILEFKLNYNNIVEVSFYPNHSYLSQLDVTYKTPDLMSHFLPPHEVSFTFCCSSIVFPR